MTPVISGTVASQTVAAGLDISPFASVTITDGNPWIENDTLTITLLDSNGQPTDANGELVLPEAFLGNADFSKTSTGVYTLVENATPTPETDLAHFQLQLANLTFIPSGAGTTTFSLYNLDTDDGHQSDDTTSVIASGDGAPLESAPSIVAPTLATLTATEDVQTISATEDSVPAIDTPADVTSDVVDLNELAATDSESFDKDLLPISSESDDTSGSDSSAVADDKTGGCTHSIYTPDGTHHFADTWLATS